MVVKVLLDCVGPGSQAPEHGDVLVTVDLEAQLGQGRVPGKGWVRETAACVGGSRPLPPPYSGPTMEVRFT